MPASNLCLTLAPACPLHDDIAPRHQGDLGQVVFVIIFILFTLAKLIGSVLEQKPNRNTGPRPSHRPSRSDDATEEIRKFLERAARQKQEERSTSSANQAATSRSARSDSGNVVDAELVSGNRGAGDRATDENFLGGNSVSEHVQRHLGGEHLGHKVPRLVEADEQLESHLHQVFDHKVGEIARGAPTPIREGTDDPALSPHESASNPRPKNLAQLIAGQLRDPSQVRQAIILNEILRRPVDRL